jgi:hypothetical protein
VTATAGTRRWSGRPRDRGATSTEVVIVFPAVLVVVLLALQFGLLLHAGQIAEAAAQEAVEAAQAEGGGTEQGYAAARSLLSDLGGLRAPLIDVRRTAVTVTSTVTGRAQQVVPGFSTAVSGSAQGPVERFVEDTPR